MSSTFCSLGCLWVMPTLEVGAEDHTQPRAWGFPVCLNPLNARRLHALLVGCVVAVHWLHRLCAFSKHCGLLCVLATNRLQIQMQLSTESLSPK